MGRPSSAAQSRYAAWSKFSAPSGSKSDQTSAAEGMRPRYTGASVLSASWATYPRFFSSRPSEGASTLEIRVSPQR